MLGFIVFALGMTALLAALYNWRWLLIHADPLAERLGRLTTRLLIGGVGALLVMWEVRNGADALFGSLIGQALFVGFSGVLLLLAWQARSRQR